ncbi:SDR family NAD(P)-dependent oxidoreductase [Deinococcus sp.]|uniref:SDR family NAD(P)-dependent oxidoreductase n=1 Tax=Deinococcus sp. TaxID=47478 RepID=UPI003B5934C1
MSSPAFQHSPDDLHGCVALVTGASSGIGEATARALAARGASVSLVARRQDELEALAADLNGQGQQAGVVAADVTEQVQAERAVQQTVERWGRLDIVVNSAGLTLFESADNPLEAHLEDWNKMVALNISGLLYIVHAALPHLLSAAETSSRRVSDLVNVSSVSGRRPQAGASVYGMTKAGVISFSEALRQSVAKRHLRVGVIEPGTTDTEMKSHQRPEVQQQIEKRLAGLELLRAADVADAVLYMVTRPRRAAVSELTVRPTEQA